MRSYYTAGRLAKSEQSQLSGSDTGGGGAGAGTPEGPPAHVAVRPAALEISERAVWHHGRRDVLCDVTSDSYGSLLAARFLTVPVPNQRQPKCPCPAQCGRQQWCVCAVARRPDTAANGGEF